MRLNLVELMESRREQMQINVKIAKEHIDVNVLDELTIDPSDLSTEYMAVPGQIAYWIAVSARYKVVLGVIERAFDDWYGPLYEAEFVRYEKESGRKPNMSSVDYLVRIRNRDEYNRRKEELDQAQADSKVIEGMVTSLQVKVQSLMQISKSKQVEYEHTEVSYRGKVSNSGPSVPQQPVAYSRADSDVAVKDATNSLRNLIGGKK